MKDDIKPSVDSRPKFQEINEETDNPEPILYESPNAGETQPKTHLSSEEDGFVITPDGKQIKNPFSKLINKLKSLSKKQKVILWIVSIMLLAGIATGVYAVFLKKTPVPEAKPAPVVQKKEEPPKPTTEASRLTGLQITPELNKRPVTSIQIENSPDARPQSGLLDAGVVFEAIAEGGITRFNASFLEAQPAFIGPIRSVRPYYAQLAAPFDPIFVHAGGSAEGLQTLANLGLKDLDHGANGGAFQRIPERYAPHNLFSTTADLDKASVGRGYTTSDVKGFLRKQPKPGQAVTAQSIDFNISSALYNVHYDYNASTNVYNRVMAGTPHVDWKSGKQLTPNVVIAMVVPWSQNGIYSVYGIIGSGTAYIFQDGQVNQVTWTKASAKEQIVFTGADSKPFGINPGQTWISLVRQTSDVRYAP